MPEQESDMPKGAKEWKMPDSRQLEKDKQEKLQKGDEITANITPKKREVADDRRELDLARKEQVKNSAIEIKERPITPQEQIDQRFKKQIQEEIRSGTYEQKSEERWDRAMGKDKETPQLIALRKQLQEEAHYVATTAQRIQDKIENNQSGIGNDDYKHDLRAILMLKNSRSPDSTISSFERLQKEQDEELRAIQKVQEKIEKSKNGDNKYYQDKLEMIKYLRRDLRLFELKRLLKEKR